MGYLETSSVAEFSKCVMSFWFRVPSESIASGGGGDDPNFQALPLVMFGPRIKEMAGGIVTTNNVTVVPSGNPSGEQILGTPEQYGVFTSAIGPTRATGHYLPPSFIGIDCHDPSKPTLVINIQMPNAGTSVNTDFAVESATMWDETDPDAPGDPFAPGSGLVYQANPFGASTVFDARVQYAGLSDASSSRSLNPENFFLRTSIKVSPDRWHHVIFSCDVSNSISASGDGGVVSGGETFFVAFDDVHYHGDDLGGDNSGDLFVTANADDAAASSSGYDSFNFFIPAGSYTYNPKPVSAAPFGIPASSNYSGRIKKVEMAEFQFFSGLTLDTSSAGNRRLFITAEGKPERPGVAKLALGEPDILLHRSGNWKNGRNTGADGDFDAIGKIKRWRPDPSLHGPQSPT